jgi:hypothetical protein
MASTAAIDRRSQILARWGGPATMTAGALAIVEVLSPWDGAAGSALFFVFLLFLLVGLTGFHTHQRHAYGRPTRSRCTRSWPGRSSRPSRPSATCSAPSVPAARRCRITRTAARVPLLRRVDPPRPAPAVEDPRQHRATRCERATVMTMCSASRPGPPRRTRRFVRRAGGGRLRRSGEGSSPAAARGVGERAGR